MEETKRITAPVGRVKCYVEFCKYYGVGDLCMAQSIKVKPLAANGSKTVNCATFMEKDV